MRPRHRVALVLFAVSVIGMPSSAGGAASNLSVEFRDSRRAIVCNAPTGPESSRLVIAASDKVFPCGNIEIRPANISEEARIESLPEADEALVDSVRLTNMLITAKSSVSNFSIIVHKTVRRRVKSDVSYRASVLGRLSKDNGNSVRITAYVAHPPDARPIQMGTPMACNVVCETCNQKEWHVCDETMNLKWPASAGRAGLIGDRLLTLEITFSLTANSRLDLGRWVRLVSVRPVQ